MSLLRGVGQPAIASTSVVPVLAPRATRASLLSAPWRLTTGVGHVAKSNQPVPLPDLRGVHGTSRNIECPYLVAEPLHFKKDSVEVQVGNSKRRFEKASIRLDFLKHSQSFLPEPAVISLASLLPGSTAWLAWRSSGEKGSASVPSSVEGTYIGMGLDSVGSLYEFSASLVFFAHSDGSEPSPRSGNCESSEAGEKVNVSWLIQDLARRALSLRHFAISFLSRASSLRSASVSANGPTGCDTQISSLVLPTTLYTSSALKMKKVLGIVVHRSEDSFEVIAVGHRTNRPVLKAFGFRPRRDLLGGFHDVRRNIEVKNQLSHRR
jgi:hypothetical protein